MRGLSGARAGHHRGCTRRSCRSTCQHTPSFSRGLAPRSSCMKRKYSMSIMICPNYASACSCATRATPPRGTHGTRGTRCTPSRFNLKVGVTVETTQDYLRLAVAFAVLVRGSTRPTPSSVRSRITATLAPCGQRPTKTNTLVVGARSSGLVSLRSAFTVHALI